MSERRYSYTHTLRIRAEEELIGKRTGLVHGTVLELGAGEGRVTRLARRQARMLFVTDVDEAALRKARESSGSCSEHHLVCDARRIPLPNQAVDAVIFSFNGLDYIPSKVGRIRALREIDRVLRTGGSFIFSAHNPLGTVLSPRGLGSAQSLWWRGRYIRMGGWRRPTFEDHNALELAQRLPWQVIAEVERFTRMRFRTAMARNGLVRMWPLICLFSAWPYYVFQKEAEW